MPLSPEEHTLLKTINSVLFGSIYKFGAIKSLMKKSTQRIISSNAVILQSNDYNHTSISWRQSEATKIIRTCSFLKYDYYTPVMIIYNNSREVLNIAVKDGDADTASVEETLPYTTSGTVRLYPFRRLIIDPNRIDLAQLESVGRLLNFVKYMGIAISHKTPYSLSYSNQVILRQANTLLSASDISKIYSVENTVRNDSYTKASFHNFTSTNSIKQLVSSYNITMSSSLKGLYVYDSFVSSASSGFGTKVRISSDKIIISAPGVNNNAGQVLIYDYDFNQLAVISGSDTVAGDRFGDSVALSPDGSLLMVGSSCSFNTSIQKMYLFQLSDYSQIQQIFDPFGDAASRFAEDFCMSNDNSILVVSSPGFLITEGIVHIYVYSFGTYSLSTDLIAPLGGNFGYRAAFSGANIVVTAGNAVGNSSTGVVYIYRDLGSGYSLSQTINCPESGQQGFGSVVDTTENDIYLTYGSSSYKVVKYSFDGSLYALSGMALDLDINPNVITVNDLAVPDIILSDASVVKLYNSDVSGQRIIPNIGYSDFGSDIRVFKATDILLVSDVTGAKVYKFIRRA